MPLSKMVKISSANNIYYDDVQYDRLRNDSVQLLCCWLTNKMPITIIWDHCNTCGFTDYTMSYDIQYNPHTRDIILQDADVGTITMNNYYVFGISNKLSVTSDADNTCSFIFNIDDIQVNEIERQMYYDGLIMLKCIITSRAKVCRACGSGGGWLFK